MADNSITIVGNLTRDPEIRYTASGQANARLGIAVSRRWQNRQTNEWEERTSFFNVVAWGDMAENISDTLAKGNRVIVNGRLEQRSWETDQGEKRSVVEVVADEIGPSLRWATASVTRSERRGGGGQPGGGGDFGGGGGGRAGACGGAAPSGGGQSSSGPNSGGPSGGAQARRRRLRLRRRALLGDEQMARDRERRKSPANDRRRVQKKKVSILTQDRIDYVDYKDVNLLRRFMSERAKIRARRVTGNNQQQQREIAKAIRIAREMALLPYSVRQVTQRSRSGRRDRDRLDPNAPMPTPDAPPPVVRPRARANCPRACRWTAAEDDRDVEAWRSTPSRRAERMKIVLREDVEQLGKKGDLLEVAPGYARNYLVPRGLAMVASKGAEKQAAAMRRNRDVRDARDREQAQGAAAKLVASPVQVAARAGEGGKFFGSVGAPTSPPRSRPPPASPWTGARSASTSR